MAVASKTEFEKCANILITKKTPQENNRTKVTHAEKIACFEYGSTSTAIVYSAVATVFLIRMAYEFAHLQ